MSGELNLHTTSGLTVKAIVWELEDAVATGRRWNGSAMVVPSDSIDDAGWATGMVACAELLTKTDGTGTGTYVGTFPAGITAARRYRIEFYSGASPTPGQAVIDTQELDWGGSSLSRVRDEVERLYGISRWPITGGAPIFALEGNDNGRGTWPSIVWDGSSTWVLYYTATVSGKLAIRRRTSTDGKTSWSAGATVLEGTTAEWDSAGLWSPVVWREGAGDWRMLYTAKQPDTDIAVGYATSADGITWTKEATNPVMSPTLTWERNSNEVTGVIKISSTYYMWYTTLRTASHQPSYDRKIGYATSTDLITWTKAGNPVFGDVDNLSHRQPFLGYYAGSPFRNGASGNYYLLVSVYGANSDYSRAELWESFEPTFDSAFRRRVATIQTASNDGVSYPERDLDFYSPATDDITRSTWTATSGEIRIYAGVNHNAVWSTALFTKPTIADALRWVPAIQEPILDVLPHTRWDQSAAAVSGGARTITITVDDGTTALESARVRVTQGAETYELSTNASGQAVFALDDATWTVAITKPLFTFTNTTLIVSADASQTYSMTSIAVPASNPGRVTGFIYTYDEDGAVAVGVVVSLQAAKFPGKGLSLDTAVRTSTSDANGLVTFTNLFAGTTYRMRRGSDRDWVSAKIPVTASGTIELDNVLGADD